TAIVGRYEIPLFPEDISDIAVHKPNMIACNRFSLSKIRNKKLDPVLRPYWSRCKTVMSAALIKLFAISFPVNCYANSESFIRGFPLLYDLTSTRLRT